MIKMKTLVLLCDNYPLTPYEPFLESEIKAIGSNFERVLVLIPDQKKQNEGIFIPENLKVKTFNNDLSSYEKLKGIFNVFSKPVLQEFFWMVKNRFFKLSNLKILLMEAIKANKLKKTLKDLFNDENIKLDQLILYSYWHDYRALSIAQITSSDTRIKSISRAHRWDIYFNENPNKYLPFKSYIVQNLNATFSISQNGKEEFERVLKRNLDNKVVVSRLGKYNDRRMNRNKINDQFIICSCSTLIPVKRVNLIIDILSNLEIPKLKWIHFGAGILENELKQLASEKLSHIDFDFKGYTSNDDILDFYRDNYVDLFINVSESEGIPYSIMEAISAGITVLATNVGGTGEAIRKDFGFLLDKNFTNDEAISIIEKYSKLEINDKLKMRDSAVNFWKDNFEAEKNFVNFYKQLQSL